jgi:hypothetical protein
VLINSSIGGAFIHLVSNIISLELLPKIIINFDLEKFNVCSFNSSCEENKIVPLFSLPSPDLVDSIIALIKS